MALTTKPEYDPGAPMSLLGRTRMVLIGTTHPGNIGAAARAMKAMGLRRLVLVDPKSFPAAEATAMASGADDLLAAAEVVETLDEGLSGCGLVVGTTARPRHLEWPVHEPQAAMAKAAGAVDCLTGVLWRDPAKGAGGEVGIGMR